MKTISCALITFGMAVIALSACSDGGSLSGRYVASFQGEEMAINFIDDSKAIFSMAGGGADESVDCTYEAGEKLISLQCFGSSGISLTRIDGGLEADMGGVVVRYKKQ